MKPAARNIIGYVRVSTDKQAEEGVSLEAQQAKIRQYADLYDLNLVRIEVDAASAKNLDRPALASALAALSSGEADGILVVKLDRLTRSVRDLADLLDIQQDEGWSILSVQDSLDTSTAAGRLVINVLISVSQWEREAIGERTAAAMQHMKANGEYTGGEAPYGFAVVDGHLVPAPEERAAIAKAKDLRARGVSLRQIGARLVESGYLPRGCKTEWSASSIKRMVEA